MLSRQIGDDYGIGASGFKGPGFYDANFIVELCVV